MNSRFAWLALPPLVLIPGLAAAAGTDSPVALWTAAPFVLLLLVIAFVPLISRGWWDRWYPAVSLGLGAAMLGYYLWVLRDSASVLHTGREYLGFIVLIGSLFVVAGGIHVRIKGRSTPLANVGILFTGSLLANLVGTTGAAMLLIRPYIHLNRSRIRAYHIVFFIFLIGNMGGALTPVGDPPLFLGYLRGVPFFWVAQNLWLPWALGIAMVLGVFFVLDTMHSRRQPHAVRDGAEGEEWDISGMHNLFFLVVILAAVFVTDPPFVREVLMIAAATGSYLTTGNAIHRKNGFDLVPIKEVAILFAGIFATMIPALQWLEFNASSLGLQSAGHFYWATGMLSSVLDNAPTYLSFYSAAIGVSVDEATVRQAQQLLLLHGADAVKASAGYSLEIQRTVAACARFYGGLSGDGGQMIDRLRACTLIGNNAGHLQAVSLAAVFFGAMTYIGNGPNFMVKSIAERAGVRCPTFAGYVVRYSLPVLLPVFALVWLLFFRGW